MWESLEIPDSALKSEVELSSEKFAENVDLDNLGVGTLDGLTSGIGRILEDAKKARREEGRRVSRRSARLTGWQGFWESMDPSTVCGIFARCMAGLTAIQLGSDEKPASKVFGDHPVLAMLGLGANESGALKAVALC